MPFMMIDKPIKRRTLAQDIVKLFEEMIIDGKLKVGEKLPPEQELSNNLHVSRNVIREAINTLATEGLITKLGNKGSFIAVPDYKIIEDSIKRMLVLGNLSVDEIFEIRTTIEVAAAGLAAIKAKKTDIVKLTEIVNTMSKVYNDKEKWCAYDLKFHIEVSALSRNPLIYHLIKPLNTHLLYWIEIGYDVGGPVIADHIEIHDSIKMNDPITTEKIMKRHITQAYERVKKCLSM